MKWNTTYKNLIDASKAIVRERIIAINDCIKKKKISSKQPNILKELEKEEQIKPKYIVDGRK